MDRGFEMMIPREKEVEPTHFNYQIKFKFLGKEFNLSFQVKKPRDESWST